MNNPTWKNDITGNGKENQILGKTGCAITEESSVISSALGKEITPQDINDDKNNFVEDTDLLDMQKVAEDNGLEFDYWTREKQGNLSKKIFELSEADTGYFISAQVAYNSDESLHWVGVEEIEKRINGKSYVKIEPSSSYDTDKNNRTRKSWVLDKNGDMWVDTSDIKKIYTYTTKKNK